MIRPFSVLLAGLACGLAAHFGWYAAHRPARGGDLDTELGWMQEILQLSPEQFARIKALHEQSRPQMQALAAQLAQMREEFALYEHAQKENGSIDFVAFARFVRERWSVNHACLQSAQTLVRASSEVMDPRQRQLYLTIVEPALSATAKDRLD